MKINWTMILEKKYTEQWFYHENELDKDFYYKIVFATKMQWKLQKKNKKKCIGLDLIIKIH